ncbi:hypothetical protein E2I00_009593 [Balaenoptera physalus]|uniref:Protein RER1 n=1 Tax=Balaenoptera physalus TaxID=9770 RepID=A0A6A1QDT4_BALPH|nr:hypothetical protein E2I00_009593 [Balaenoptera physalus]
MSCSRTVSSYGDRTPRQEPPRRHLDDVTLWLSQLQRTHSQEAEQHIDIEMNRDAIALKYPAHQTTARTMCNAQPVAYGFMIHKDGSMKHFQGGLAMESSPVPEDFIKFLPVCGSVYMRWQRRGGRGARLPLPGPSEAPAWPPPTSSFPRPSGDRAWQQWTASRSEGDSVGDSVHGKPSVVYRFFTSLGQVYQAWLDKSTPYTAVRWVVTLGLSFIYMIRVYLLPGWYIVTYALGIHHLNLLIAFLSPKVDPSLMEDSDDGPSLPTKQNEFQSSIRRLPEFKSWHVVTKGILVAMVCTFFEAFNVPVFWPILVMYFIMLFCITMKRQITHMIEYRYIPRSRTARRHTRGRRTRARRSPARRGHPPRALDGHELL